MTTPAWARQATWYHLYPLGFLGAEPRNPHPIAPDAPVQHRLRALEPWLGYLVELGAEGLLLGPVFASESHGYDTVDYFRIDPRLGDEDDLIWLCDACHRRGLRVLLDGVFNHVARSFPAFADVLARRAESRHAGWFHLHFDVTRPDHFTYETFEGHPHLVALNHAEPAVLELAATAACHWIDRGADGFRLDAAYAVPPRFWAAFAERVRARRPDAYLLGEMIHGDYSRFVRESTLDAVTQYELWKAIWSGLNDRNLFELAHALRRHQSFLDVFPPLTFLGNHDVTRIASQLHEPGHLGHALAVLFTLPGTPAIYAGDEQGWRGVKHHREGGDAEIRRPFPRSPEDLGEAGASAYRLHQELIRLRRAHRFLTDGRLHILHLTNLQLVYEVRSDTGEALLTGLNLADRPIGVDLSGAAAGDLRVVAGHQATVDSLATGQRLTFPARSWTVLGHGPAVLSPTSRCGK
jgi:cyclomaltodextrinase